MPASDGELISIYEMQYEDAIKADKITPLILPYHFLNFFALILYILLSPYSAVRRIRFLVFGFILWFSVSMLLNCRTLNHSYGAIIGLYSIWCIYWSATLIVFNDPWRNFKRVTYGPQNSLTWQAMPVSLKDRVSWTLDLVSTLRGTNWSFRFRDPSKIPKPLSKLRDTGSPTLGTLFGRFTLSCVCIDVLKLGMMTDPYFWGYTSSTAPSHFPFFLRNPLILSLYRSVLTTMGIKAALHFQSDLGALICIHLFGPRILGPSGEAWMHPPIFGAFSAVLDDGLVGFWGKWWHQIFRLPFTSTGRWIVEHLGLDPKSEKASAVVMITAFFMSGILHASSTLTLWGETRPWLDVCFFILQPVGIGLQTLLQRAVGQRYREKQEARWALNITTSFLWYYLTMPLLAEGLAAGGIWLFEPIPVSLLRGLGFGTAFGMPKRWWCWRGQWFRWYDDGTWWRRGVAM
ncbi:hypothetical protein K432DRAFT_296154 [Lepidopterella palustris CBS 459.81]|uniref:Wax synthase domain-containing protein n=1 Tax=Lepidopterella palustris CBS 459.81 TaxID=1314670 RepID=A0A8E2ECD6_9PEZI|nr:hypothetical protein K432DRAFT_296154 [Lepidopterella palustris CBS 459.81]